MPIKTKLDLVKPDFKRQVFPTPSKACNRERGLYQELKTTFVLDAKNNGVFTKTGWSACPQAPSAAGRKKLTGLR
jgi:hypothetical protein